MLRMFGQYELRRVLGRGGMGVVYEAVDTIRNRTVALKLLPPECADDPAFQARFRRESQLAARLADPHIIPIHDFGEIDGQLYLDMRLVDGRDLGDFIRRRGAIAPTAVAAIVSQIGSALDSAHEHGLIHRDVKPSNILLTSIRESPELQAFAYLVDFGIARATVDGGTPLTASGTVGTVSYMPPERIAGAPGDARSDVYSLACLAYEALTAKKPFDGEMVAVMFAHINTPPPRVTDILPSAPAALDGVLARGMAKNPAQRFASAGQFCVALGDAVREQSNENLKALAPATVASASTQEMTILRAGSAREARVAGGFSDEHPSGPVAGAAVPAFRPRRRRTMIGGAAIVFVLAAATTLLVVRPWSAATPRHSATVPPLLPTGSATQQVTWTHFQAFSKLVGSGNNDTSHSWDNSACVLTAPTKRDPDGVMDGVTCQDQAEGALQIIVDRFSAPRKARDYLNNLVTLSKYAAVPVRMNERTVGALFLSPTTSAEVNATTYFCGLPSYLVQFRVLNGSAAVRNAVQTAYWASAAFPDAIPPSCNADYTGSAAGSKAIAGDTTQKTPVLNQTVPLGS